MEDDYDKKLREYEDMLNDLPDDEDDKPAKTSEKKNADIDFDEYEKMLLEMDKKIPENKFEPMDEEKKKPVAQPQPRASPPQKKSDSPPSKKMVVSSFIENEMKFSNPEIIKSFVIIKQELDYIEQGLKNKSLGKEIIEFLLNKKEKIRENKNSLSKMIMSGQLNGKTYCGLVENLFSQHMKLFATAKQMGDKSILARISSRMGGLDKEKTQLKKNPEAEFKGILKAFAPDLANVSINPNATFKSDIPKESERFTSNIASKPLSEFQGNLNVSSLYLSEIDKYAPAKKISEIRKRHKEYHNLALYWAKHVKKNNK